ncbi:MAG: hypothetical protein E7437_05140 [Ruminococcaceae bacterium]|nr:hypothetical protein [Oscillospiraceae bacterium]
MDLLKKAFPISFRFADSIANLIIGILVYLVGGAIAGSVIGFLSGIAVVGIVFGIVGSVLGIYCLAGIVIEVLVFLDILK